MLIDSYAKINLYLEVLNKRIDGYHEIETVFCTIDLHDSLKFVLTKKPEIQILANIPELSSSDNLVYKIATRICNDFSVNSGLQILLEKRIPISAGLGGGSSNAAMTFVALNKMLNLDMTEDYVHNTAREYGSDLNFFFLGGRARGSGKGDFVTPLPEIDPLDLLLVKPAFGVSSQEAYQMIDLKAKTYHQEKSWYNRLEAGVADRYPAIAMIINELKTLGATQAMMSGSGSTCIGLFADKALRSKAAGIFASQGMWTCETRTIGRKEYQACFQS